MAVGVGPADGGAAGGGGAGAFDRRGRGEIGRGGGAERRRVADLPALRRGRRGAQGQGARPVALSLQILRPDLQRGDRDAAARAAQEAALAVVRGIPGGGRDGGDIRAALRHRAVDRLPVAAPVPGRLAAGSRDAAGDRGGGRDLSPSKPERRAQHGPAAQAARRKGEDARAVQGSRAGPVRRGPVGRDPRRSAGLDAGGGGRGRAPPGRGGGRRAGHRRGELLPALRPIARIVPHRSEPIRRTANPGALPHPDGRQPAKPLQGIPVPLPRRRDEISRKLPPVVPARLPRRKRKPVNLPRGRRQFGMHTNRKMSHRNFKSGINLIEEEIEMDESENIQIALDWVNEFVQELQNLFEAT